MNPYDARIERVYTRLTGIDAPDETPNVDPPNAPALTFEVVVEAIAGSIKRGDLSPFTLTLVAEDVASTTPSSAAFYAAFGLSAPAAISTFSTTLVTVAAPGPGLLQAWPAYKLVFQITLVPSGAGQNYIPGHTYQYHATMVGGGFYVVSIADSPQFVLF
jgi:hypothetical protein